MVTKTKKVYTLGKYKFTYVEMNSFCSPDSVRINEVMNVIKRGSSSLVQFNQGFIIMNHCVSYLINLIFRSMVLS